MIKLSEKYNIRRAEPEARWLLYFAGSFIVVLLENNKEYVIILLSENLIDISNWVSSNGAFSLKP